jgi:plastocyanin
MRSSSRTVPRRALAAAALGLTLVAGACGSGSDGEPAAAGGPDSGTAGNVLTIRDFAFSPEPLRVPVGTVVKVVNEDDAPHTATADDKSFDTGSLGGNESREITLSTAGEVAYHCSIHDYMRGVIRVGD